MIKNKIDFTAIISVTRANPNGDPSGDNRPRETSEGYGLISDVCIKRKIRNRLQDFGQAIFVQSDDRCNDGFGSLQERANNTPELQMAKKSEDKTTDPKKLFIQAACKKWIDTRAFGQLFAFQSDSNSASVRGPVSIQIAKSVDPINITDMGITKSVNGSQTDGKASDTMGNKAIVDFGVYIVRGSINVVLAQKTGFSDEDAELVKKAIATMFENDASAARPEGSMIVEKLYWWKHNCQEGQYPSYKVFDSVRVEHKDGVVSPQSMDDYDIKYIPLDGLDAEII